MSTSRTIAAMLWELRRLRRRATWSRPQLEAHQHKRCAQLRTRAYAESRFYQDFHAGYADAPLHELPVLTKAMMREHFDEIVTDASITKEKLDQYTPTMHPDDWLHDRYVVATTAGTTGAPAHMLYARAEWATALASFARFEDHVGSLWGAWQRPKMAVVASNTPWHISARMGATVRSSWLPMLRLDIGQPLSQIVAELNAWQPYLLATYASMAGVLAEEQRAGRLHIAPRRIVTAAEVLSPALRQRVQTVWGDIVFGQYGATEGGIFAAECPAHGIVAHEDGARDSAGATSCRQTGGLHLFEDLFIFEVVDRQNRPVPPGRYGDKVLVTVLFNHTVPLIRYELSDSVCMATGPCICGSAYRLITGIQGRQEEMLYLPARDGGTVAVHPMVFFRILDPLPVSGWRIEHIHDSLWLRLSGQNGTVDVDAVKRRLHDALEYQNIVVPPLNVVWTDDSLRSASGKVIHIRTHK